MSLSIFIKVTSFPYISDDKEKALQDSLVGAFCPIALNRDVNDANSMDNTPIYKGTFLQCLARYLNLFTTSKLGNEVRNAYDETGMSDIEQSIDIEWPVNADQLHGLILRLSLYYSDDLQRYFEKEQKAAYDLHIETFRENKSISSPIIMALAARLLFMNIIVHVDEKQKPDLLFPYPKYNGSAKPQYGDYKRCPMRVVLCSNGEFQLLMPKLYVEEIRPWDETENLRRLKLQRKWITLDADGKKTKSFDINLVQKCGPLETQHRMGLAETVLEQQFPNPRSANDNPEGTLYNVQDLISALEQAGVRTVCIIMYRCLYIHSFIDAVSNGCSCVNLL